MIFTPNDIARYLYCPLLPRKKEHLVYPAMSVFETCIGESIKQAEKSCLIKESELLPRKITKAWDDIWWPMVAANKINFKEAKAKTIKASPYFIDYCKYDISDHLHPTVGVDIETKIPIGQSILHSHIDLIKVDLTLQEKNMMLIDFSKKEMKTVDAGLDPGIAATALGLSRGAGESIQYVLVEIDEKKDKLFVTTSVFRPSDLDNIRNMILSIERNIRKNVVYGDRWKCKECQACPSFKYLMNEDGRLRQ